MSSKVLRMRNMFLAAILALVALWPDGRQSRS